jgi:predicted nucleic acid-binding protein
MVIFVDTSALYALMDADDANHPEARQLWERWLGKNTQFATSNYVLLESTTLLQRRLGLKAARLFQEELMPCLHVHWVDEALHSVAVKTLLATGRRDLSLVDSTSFEIMRILGLRTVFGFDRHFVDQGFSQLS